MFCLTEKASMILTELPLYFELDEEKEQVNIYRGKIPDVTLTLILKAKIYTLKFYILLDF
jgi:hypothetical protein